MSKQVRRSIALAILMASSSGVAAGPAADWATACAKCHGLSASDFARKELRVKDGGIVGHESGVEVGQYLTQGHGRLTPDAIAGLTAFLYGLATTK